MNKRKVYNYTRRTLAFLLSMIMTLSVLQGASVTAYAQTGSDVVVTETESSDVIEETETTVSNTEEASETVTEEVDESITGPVSTEATSIVEEDSSAVTEETSETTETVVEVIETTVEEAETITVVDVMENGSTYTGEVSEDESTLTISENGVVTAGGTFDDATIIGILETRANASENYSTVVVEYNSITDVVSQNLWNAFVSIGANTAVVCFDGGSNPDERWTFYNPTANENLGDADLSVDIAVRDDGNITFSREYINYSCSGGAVLELCLDDLEAQAEWFEAFKSAYGEESVEYIEIRDEDNNERSSEYGASYSYSDDSCVMAIDFGDTYGSTTFSLHKPHMGYERTEDDGRSIFVIDEWVMPSNRGINQNGLSILEANSNKYDVVEFIYRPDFEDKCTGYVVMDVWNTACSMLKESTENSASQIRVNFCGGATEADENWCIDNPQVINDSSVFLEVSLTPSTENNNAVFEIEANGIYNVTESNVSLSFCVDENGRKELFDSFVNAYGTQNMRLEFHDEEGNLAVSTNLSGDYQYNNEEENKNINISINGVTALDIYSPYSVVEYVYRGDCDGWDEEDGYHFRNIYIHPGNIEKDSFTAEEITEILGNYEEKSFDEITVVFCTDTMGGTVDDAIINATLPYLKDSSEDRTSTTRICFQNPETHEEFSWILVGPGTQTADQNLTGSFAIVEGEAVVSVGSQTFVADCVNLNISRSNESDADGVAALKALWGEKSTALSVGDTDVPAGFDMDDGGAWVWIDDINQLTPNASYVIEQYIYKGRIDTWDDGRKELFIHYGDAGKETAFSEQELLDILANYENYKEYNEEDNLYSVYIEQPTGENDMIYKSVADAAANLLPNGGDVKFAFRDQEKQSSVEWIFEGIKAGVVQSADQNVKASLSATSENKLFFNRNAFTLTAGEEGTVSIGFNVHTQDNYDLREGIISAIGDGYDYYLIETAGEEVGGEVSYNWSDSNIWLYLNNITVLEADKDYQLVKSFYRGKVEEKYNENGNVIGRSLYIDADGCNLSTFDEESFRGIIDYWKNKGETFEYISVEQQYGNSNIIDKDIYNAARSLLSDPVNQEMTFTFCSCQEELYGDEGNITRPFSQNDMNWHFVGCTEDTATDIDATVNIVKYGVAGGAGLSVKLKENSYPAECTNVQFWMDEGAATLESLIKPVFGKAKSESSLVVLEKATTLKTLSDGSMPAYYDNGGEEGKYNLFLSNVEEWTPNIDNRLFEAYIRPEAPIGEQASVVLFTYDPNDPEDPAYPPEDENAEWNHPDMPASNIKFTLLTPDIATMGYRVNNKGTRYDYVIPSSPWKTVYTLCTYKSISNETCYEVLAYPTCVEVTGLLFKEKEVTIEWDGTFDEPQFGYLGVNVYPLSAQNHINPQDFTWTVSGNSIGLTEQPYIVWDEETQSDIEQGTRPDGGFIVNGYGETTITVQYRDLLPTTCVVNVVAPVQVPEINSIFAIPAIDTKLSDLGNLDELIRARCNEEYKNYTGTFTWKDDSISLAPYANMEWAEFGAVYTEADGREVPVTIPVDMLRVTELGLYSAFVYDDTISGNTIKELGIAPLDGSTVLKGEELIMGYQVGINREQFNEDGMTDEFAAFARYIAEGKLEIRWSSKETLNEVPSDTEEGSLYHNGTIQKPRGYMAAAKGKKVFTVEAVNLLTNKAIFKNSATVIVNEKPLFDFSEGSFDFKDNIDPVNEMKGTYTITVSGNNCDFVKKLTIKSADTSVLKLGSINKSAPVDGKVVITIPYEFKKFGKTVIKVTAADEVKSSKSFAVERVDYDAKIPDVNYTIDKSWLTTVDDTMISVCLDVINIAFQKNTTPAGMVSILEPEYQSVFRLGGNFEEGEYWIGVTDSSLKNKTYTLTLKIPYTIKGDENGEVRYSEQKIKVKVIQSKVKVTAKQTKKINEFYKLSSEKINGVITLNTPAHLTELSLNDDSVFDLKKIQGNGAGKYVYGIVLKEGQNIEKLTDTQKKITLNYTLIKNGIYKGSVNLTLKTENKKPTLVLPKKSDTLYPNMGVDGSGFVVMDKATGELLDLTGNVSLVTNKKKNETQVITDVSDPASAPYEYLAIGKNNYYIYTKDEILNYRVYDSSKAVKATDKFTIRVQQPDWNGYADVTYSAKINLNIAKLKLDNKTLSINANDAIYRYQTAGTHVNLTGYAGTQFDELWITGSNDASIKALKNNLCYNWNREESKIRFTIVNKGNEEDGTLLKNGTYKFKVWTSLNGHTISTDLVLKVIDKSPAKSVKVVKKGSIDVLRRDTTQITMNPKLSNMSGELVNFRLTGPDADLFNYYYDWESSTCVVKARYGVNYSTKITYRVTPVYIIEDEGAYYVTGTQQKIKVTQGKPKISTWSTASTIYGDKSIGALIGFEAMLKDEFITIENVELLNYTNDLDWCWEPMMDANYENFVDGDDPNGHPFEGAGRLTLNDNTPKDITKASGKYTLKFAVTYRDAAGNEKAKQVSYKLNIVR